VLVVQSTPLELYKTLALYNAQSDVALDCFTMRNPTLYLYM
jgi:hypothetical protein